MKGFYIEITNNLLEPKHREQMKESVWLFMWFIDKMTSITEEGVGMVLGGKPIKYEEVNEDLDIPERTYKRWISKLKKYKYINIKRAPYGLIITINKAKKRFGRSAKNGTTRYAKNSKEICQKVSRDVPKTPYLIKTINKDINKDKEKREKTPLKDIFEKEIKTISLSRKEFLDYWTEKSPNGKKERWEMEKVFDVKRRWATWLRNEKKFNKNKDNTVGVDWDKLTSEQKGRMSQN